MEDQKRMLIWGGGIKGGGEGGNKIKKMLDMRRGSNRNWSMNGSKEERGCRVEK